MPELTRELRDDLKIWNDSWEERDPLFDEKVTRLQEQGRQLAVRVQEELGPDDWEVLYKLHHEVIERLAEMLPYTRARCR